ncbi:VOC family protein [Pseudolabrys taiwanensis]|uniref:VOC family protein n=1 Tax=Pseudolabrys taiwanensis TaxID=331696 RepID=A0A345ZZM4_9HYPH|nr:VOC family protein [Pseudolabrys taiwanensis]AXK82371.1 VOC family protein [Pseudolabrys taiwanensis]
MNVQPYLSFEGRCEEALDFYKKAIGAQVEVMMRFKEAPPMDSPGEGCAGPMPDANKIMHSSFKVGDAVIMATDGMASGKADFKGISLALSVKDDADAQQKFKALSEGGTVLQPLMKTFFSSSFGMLADKFGVGWMVVVPQH